MVLNKWLVVVITIDFSMFENYVVWAILIITLAIYFLLFDLVCFSKSSTHWYTRANNWQPSIKIMLSSLPLLGLLGTIGGLLTSFFAMSINNTSGEPEMMSQGIASALFTTQIGLLFVIPGWVMCGILSAKMKKWEMLTNY